MTATPDLHRDGASAKRRAMALALCTRFVDALGFGMLIPVAPFLAEDFGAGAVAVTWLTAAYPLMNVFCAPLAGRLADRVGRRPVLIAGSLVNAMGHLAFAAGSSLAVLFVGRLISGIGSANSAPAGAILADVTSEEERASAMSLRAASFGLGLLLGPAVGGLLAQLGLFAPPLVAGAILLAQALALAIALPETRPASVTSSRAPITALEAWGERGPVALVLWAGFAVTTGFAVMHSTLPLAIEHALVSAASAVRDASEASRREAASLTTFAAMAWGLGATVAQMLLAPRVIRALGPGIAAAVSCAVWAAVFAASPPAYGFGIGPVLAVTALASLPYGVVYPALSTLLSTTTSAQTQGRALGLLDGSYALGTVIGPAFAGFLFRIGYGVPYEIGAALVAAGGVLVWRAHAGARRDLVGAPLRSPSDAGGA